RNRVMLEMNVAEDKFEPLVKGLPSMRSPTVSPLFGGNGYAIKIAVKKSDVPTLLPKLQSLGATDIVEYELRKVMI
ncbi:MAG: ATP phosphoribosyltransferase, partial [Treponema sp.]|nr:ATP phosphoribosyltransferase [Treponema sp.]